jgi:hypothetical protein
LAWCAATEQVWSFYLAGQNAFWQQGHVAKVGDIRVVVFKDGAREWLNL